MSLKNLKIHFIAIGGSAMHQLAIALKENGNQVSGSDDEIFEPSRSRLAEAGLLPEHEGWFPEKIQNNLDLIVLGMHARADNPELLRAQQLGIRCLSYPELIFEHSRNKQRIVVAGSHGKTTTTAMIMHVLEYAGKSFDYLVGAPVKGFSRNVRLSEDAPIIIVEGDEYPCSPEDNRPKFLAYQHHIAVVTGIAWDHANVFPTEHAYVRQFDRLADASPKAGTLIVNEEDALASVICKKERDDVTVLEYGTPGHQVRNGVTYWISPEGNEIPLRFFGVHNLSNAQAAKTLLSRLGVHQDVFFSAIKSFEGASNRLEKIGEAEGISIFRDFAHAPSKVAATVSAVKTQFPGRKLVAVLELHTYSSLNKNFIGNYAGSMNGADEALVYFNPKVLINKKLEELSEKDVKTAFTREDLEVYTQSADLFDKLGKKTYPNHVLLLMSSGNFDGRDASQLAAHLCNLSSKKQ
jgi:UDP-N-acetylmuramate: L-alanyl-gamma-D-glutamyl-meso-diaminopimelate ligase